MKSTATKHDMFTVNYNIYRKLSLGMADCGSYLYICDPPLRKGPYLNS